MNRSVIEKLTSRKYRSREEAYKMAKLCSFLLGAEMFYMGENIHYCPGALCYYAIVICHLGVDMYDNVSVFQVRHRNDTDDYSVSLVCEHTYLSAGGGRIEDVFYEVRDDQYLVRIIADAHMCSCYIDKIIDRYGQVYPAHKGNIDLVFRELFKDK